jgi:AraC family transcriptional regulator, arabinose operon regulatory protein
MYDFPVESRRTESPQPPFAPFVNVAPRHELKHSGYYAWRPQGTHDWLLKHTIAGHGRFGHANGQIITEAGDVVILKPGALHDYGVPARHDHWEIIWAHFRPRPEWLEWLVWPEEAPGLMRLRIRDATDRKRIERQLHDMNRLARSDSPRREAFAMNALERALLLCDRHNPIFAARHTDPRVEAVMNYLRENLVRKFDAPACVSISGLSQSRLYHLFKTQVGQTPLEFLELLRVDRAKLLLERTSDSVQQIALEIGFDDPLYFSRRFRHRVGISPRDFRERLFNHKSGSVAEIG